MNVDNYLNNLLTILTRPQTTVYYTVVQNYYRRWVKTLSSSCNNNDNDELFTTWKAARCVICDQVPNSLSKTVSWITFGYPMSEVAILDQVSLLITAMTEEKRNLQEDLIHNITPCQVYYHFHINRCELFQVDSIERDYVKHASYLRSLFVAQKVIEYKDLTKIHALYRIISGGKTARKQGEYFIKQQRGSDNNINDDNDDGDALLALQKEDFLSSSSSNKKLMCCNDFKLKTAKRCETVTRLLFKEKPLDRLAFFNKKNRGGERSIKLFWMFNSQEEAAAAVNTPNATNNNKRGNDDNDDERICVDRVIPVIEMVYYGEEESDHEAYCRVVNNNSNSTKKYQLNIYGKNKENRCVICDLRIISEDYFLKMEEIISDETRSSMPEAPFARLHRHYVKRLPACFHPFFTPEAIRKHLDQHNNEAILCHYNSFVYFDFFKWLTTQKLKPSHLIDGTFARVYQGVLTRRTAAPCPLLILAIFVYKIISYIPETAFTCNWVYRVLITHGLYFSMYQCSSSFDYYDHHLTKRSKQNDNTLKKGRKKQQCRSNSASLLRG